MLLLENNSRYLYVQEFFFVVVIKVNATPTTGMDRIPTTVLLLALFKLRLNRNIEKWQSPKEVIEKN